MEPQQMMEQIIGMLAEMNTTQADMKSNQAKTDVNLQEMRKEIKSGQSE
jgi:hypothetical protein